MIESYYYKGFQITYNSINGNTTVCSYGAIIKSYIRLGSKGKELAEKYIEKLNKK
jgi:hypothetical protein